MKTIEQLRNEITQKIEHYELSSELCGFEIESLKIDLEIKEEKHTKVKNLLEKARRDLVNLNRK